MHAWSVFFFNNKKNYVLLYTFQKLVETDARLALRLCARVCDTKNKSPRNKAHRIYSSGFVSVNILYSCTFIFLFHTFL